MFRYTPLMSKTTCIDEKAIQYTPELRNGIAHVRTQEIFSLVIDIEDDKN